MLSGLDRCNGDDRFHTDDTFAIKFDSGDRFAVSLRDVDRRGLEAVNVFGSGRGFSRFQTDYASRISGAGPARAYLTCLLSGA